MAVATEAVKRESPGSHRDARGNRQPQENAHEIAAITFSLTNDAR
jgi:hypothetical protein